jgi:uncharacterized membrane protein YgdD (TMEM256/DUF423 family)
MKPIMLKQTIFWGAVLMAVGVGLGAFGAHGLEATLVANGRADTFETGIQYHLVHSLALVWLGLLGAHLPEKKQLLQRASYVLGAGIIFFSGSLYILAIFNVSIMGAVAPIGGTAFILGWLMVAWAIYKS